YLAYLALSPWPGRRHGLGVSALCPPPLVPVAPVQSLVSEFLSPPTMETPARSQGSVVPRYTSERVAVARGYYRLGLRSSAQTPEYEDAPVLGQGSAPPGLS